MAYNIVHINKILTYSQVDTQFVLYNVTYTNKSTKIISWKM